MSDAWQEIQAIKNKRNSLRERLQKRKKERQDILNLSDSTNVVSPLNKVLSAEGGGSGVPSPVAVKVSEDQDESDSQQGNCIDNRINSRVCPPQVDPKTETKLLAALCEISLTLPTSSFTLASSTNVSHDIIVNLLQKFATQQLITVKEKNKDGGGAAVIEVIAAEHAKLVAMVNDINNEEEKEKTIKSKETVLIEITGKRKAEDEANCEIQNKITKFAASTTSSTVTTVTATVTDKEEKRTKEKKTTDILSLLSMPSAREKENKKVGEEILALLSKPTAKERSLAERFRSQGGAQVMEFCPHGTRADCTTENCKKLHFKKIIQKHTDESLGDCSFLNTCFHMDTCKYVHYEVDGPTVPVPKEPNCGPALIEEGKVKLGQEATILYPPQWIQCDLRYLDMTVLGKFAVIMADPPWDIHMELPYGTLSDDEMRQLGIPTLQDDGLIFLWVTGRAMELGRECLKLWGYERVDEIIWVKTNQLQRIIRTGRTGHWLNHGKEHCLVGMKGSPANLNRGLDCDVIVAEVRATSHKPDEIYGIIERLSPGTRKIELFGRPHNVQPNWITLGNQVDGVRLVDPDLIKAFRKRYPDGNCMAPPKT
ncbi:methyltransferase like 3 isoform X2 [Lycorma delicatula]